MARAAQLGIALGALGAILALMGLFPGVTGITPTESIGIAQILAILVGFTLLILGALAYVKFTFYSLTPSTLMQSVGVRLSLTGLVFAALSGLADISGFGSHTSTIAAEIFLGPLQAAGVIGSFLIASLGVLIYTIAGTPDSR
jgi:uncharacterized membrane protein